MIEDPLLSCLWRVLSSCLLNALSQTVSHLIFHLVKPVFHISNLSSLSVERINVLGKAYVLTHARVHSLYYFLWREFQTFNTFETLVQVVLHSERVLSLGQDVQKVIIRQEEESWECHSLGVKVLIKAFLDSIDHVIAAVEVLIDSSLEARV